MSDRRTLPPMDVSSRLARLRPAFAEAGCDAVLVTNLTNVRYLTGFTGSAGSLLVRRGGAVLFTDGRYQTQSREQLGGAGVDASIEIGGLAEQLEALVRSIGGIGRVGL